MKHRIRAAPTARGFYARRCYERDGYVLPMYQKRRAYPKERFILTPEPTFAELAARKDAGEWYCFPYWNSNSGDYDYNTFLEWVLFDCERQQASGGDVHFAASRFHFIYRVPATPIEEMFCRGQF